VPIVKLGQPKGVMLFKVRDDIFAGILSKGIVSGSTAQAAIVSEDGSAVTVNGAGQAGDARYGTFTFLKDALASSAMSVDDFSRADGAARAYVRASIIRVPASSWSRACASARSMPARWRSRRC
jgi:methyl-accepting chemotaxis protein